MFILYLGAPLKYWEEVENVLVLSTVQFYIRSTPSLDEPAGYEEEEGGEQCHLHPVPAVAGARGAGEYAGSVLLQYKQNIKGIVARFLLKISRIKSR